MQANIDTRQRILDSARELLFLRSYADVGVAAICERAGVKKGSFYHFYRSKQALTLEVLDAQYLIMKENLIEQAFLDDLPPIERLVRFGNMVYQLQKQVQTETGYVLGCPFGNLSNEISTQDKPIRERIQKSFAKLQSLIGSVLQAAQYQGDLPQDIDLMTTAHAMLAYFEGVLLLAKNQNDPELIRRLLPAMAQIRLR